MLIITGIFSPLQECHYHSDSNLFIFLCEFYSSPPVLRRTTWHVETAEASSDSESEMMSNAKMQVAAEFAASSSNFEGRQLLSTAAKRVWDELYVCKKPVSSKLFFKVMK